MAMNESHVNVSILLDTAETSGLVLAQQLVLSGLLATLIRADVVDRGNVEDIIRIATFRNDFVCDRLLFEGKLATEVEKIRHHCLHALDLMYDDLQSSLRNY